MGTYGNGKRYVPPVAAHLRKLVQLGWQYKRIEGGCSASKTINGTLVVVKAKCYRSLFSKCVAREP